MSSVYILDINSLLELLFATIFSHSVYRQFCFVGRFFTVQKIFSLT